MKCLSWKCLKHSLHAAGNILAVWNFVWHAKDKVSDSFCKLLYIWSWHEYMLDWHITRYMTICRYDLCFSYLIWWKSLSRSNLNSVQLLPIYVRKSLGFVLFCTQLILICENIYIFFFSLGIVNNFTYRFYFFSVYHSFSSFISLKFLDACYLLSD